MQAMLSLAELNTTFMRKGDAARLLGLTPWQLNQLLFKIKPTTTRIAGVEHLFTSDVERLVGSSQVADVQKLTDPIEIRKAMRRAAGF